ncbi:MAG: 8-oxo-dGTP diphosphatase [candidate division WOR-3 bacterium]
MKKYVLGYLLRGEEILLIYKKRGLGEGLYNGFGGKIEVGENSLRALIRESKEEIGVIPIEFERVARLYFFDDVGVEMAGDVFFITKWEGEIVESDEAKPQWFKISQIPYDKMWEDDKIWLPLVLQGKRITGKFYFDDLYFDSPKLKGYTIKERILEEMFQM